MQSLHCLLVDSCVYERAASALLEMVSVTVRAMMALLVTTWLFGDEPDASCHLRTHASRLQEARPWLHQKAITMTIYDAQVKG